MMKYQIALETLTNINVYKYAAVETGRAMVDEPTGRERSWFTEIPINNRARASHCKK